MALKMIEIIKNIIGMSETTQVDAANVNDGKKTIALVDETKLAQEGNTDKIQVNKSNKRNEIYNRLTDICVEYRMDIETLKQMNFLEDISGKPLEAMTEDEINKVFSAIEGALHRDWKAFWKDRDEADIREIAYYAKRQYNREQVDASWLGQKWNDLTTEKTLQEELVAEGIIDKDTDLSNLSDEEFKLKVREYVNQEFLGELEGKTSKQIQRKYERARKQFVYFVNKFQTEREKVLLTAAIDEMDSASKTKLAEILVHSCECNGECREHVAKSVYDEVDTTKKDALDKRMTKEDAMKFYGTTFENMNKEDALNAKYKLQENSSRFMQEHGDRIDELKEKMLNGTLTAEEEAIWAEYQNKIIGQAAGATTGVAQNTNFNSNEINSFVNDVMSTAKKLGYDNDVIETIAKYVEKNPEKFSHMNKTEFIKMMDEITEGKYSEVAKNNKTSYKKNNNTAKENEKTEQNDIEKNDVKDKNSDAKKTEKDKIAKTTKSVSKPSELTQGQYANILSSHKATQNLSKKEEESKIENDDLQSDKSPKVQHKDLESYVKAEGKIAGFVEFAKEYGKKEAYTEAFANMDSVNKKFVEKSYKQENTIRQFNILKNCGTNIDVPLAWSKDASIAKLDGEILSCYYATNKAQEAVEELQEKQA